MANKEEEGTLVYREEKKKREQEMAEESKEFQHPQYGPQPGEMESKGATSRQTGQRTERVEEFQQGGSSGMSGGGVSTQGSAMESGNVGAGGRTPMSEKWQSSKEQEKKKKESSSQTGTAEAR